MKTLAEVTQDAVKRYQAQVKKDLQRAVAEACEGTPWNVARVQSDAYKLIFA